MTIVSFAFTGSQIEDVFETSVSEALSNRPNYPIDGTSISVLKSIMLYIYHPNRNEPPDPSPSIPTYDLTHTCMYYYAVCV
jgi:hypothetical protein